MPAQKVDTKYKRAITVQSGADPQIDLKPISYRVGIL